MIGIRLVTVLGTAMVVLAPPLVEAHHSAVMFEEKKEVTFQGVVKEFQYTNPHSWLLVDVTNPDGSSTTWGFEAEGPSTMLRNKIRPADFLAGTKLAQVRHGNGDTARKSKKSAHDVTKSALHSAFHSRWVGIEISS